MLTSDLLRFETDATSIRPRYLKRRHAARYLQISHDLLTIYQAHVGKTRLQLEQALSDYESDFVGYKIIRGLAKILESFTEWQSDESHDYPAIRHNLFELAEQRRPITRTPDLVHQTTAAHILQEFESRYGSLPENLYGDLPNQHILLKVKQGLKAETLVRRYNLALAQGILYRCQFMQVKVWDSYKTIFHYLKLAQLMHRIRNDRDHYIIEIDGPFALFRRTQKYGVNLARFLPALLLCDKWEMTATINTEQGLRYFYLDKNCGLASHYHAGHPFDSTVEEAFFRTFSQRKSDWQIERESEVIDLGDTVLIPDFTLSHPDGRKALLEIVGFWTPEYLSKKLDKLARARCRNLIVAVNSNLNCSKDDFSGPVVFYKTRLRAKDVLATLEAFTRSQLSRPVDA